MQKGKDRTTTNLVSIESIVKHIYKKKHAQVKICAHMYFTVPYYVTSNYSYYYKNLSMHEEFFLKSGG